MSRKHFFVVVVMKLKNLGGGEFGDYVATICMSRQECKGNQEKEKGKRI
jgi:hypothetical protein